MKSLSKKWHGIPVAAVFALLVVVVGVVSAAYVVTITDSSTTIEESISVKETEFEEEMYPCESNSWTFEVTNIASASNNITYDCTYRPDSASITGFTINGGDYLDDLNSGDNKVMVDIGAGITQSVLVTIRANNDAAPGKISVQFTVARS